MSEWWKDAPGFSCLGFEVPSPQYYQYNYTNSGTGFVGTARGDLNGDGVTSTFEIMGRVQAGALFVSPNILETNPDE